MHLTSVFIITIPLSPFDLSTNPKFHFLLVSAFVDFKIILQDAIEINGWKNHTAEFEVINNIEDLHSSVTDTYMK